jgi:osmotically-inducible protein OsmY
MFIYKDVVSYATGRSESGLQRSNPIRKGKAMESMIDDRHIRIDGAGPSCEVTEMVRARLADCCHFAHHWREISCSYEKGVLTLQGRVPSFYLKQVLQTTLKGIPGVKRIDNRVDVVSAAGLSSVRRH